MFLDELGEMSPLMQVKLLRVLQERGSAASVARELDGRRPDHRRDQPRSAQMAPTARFARICTTASTSSRSALPALRERRDDIPVLAGHFVQRFSRDMRRPGAALTAEALDALMRHAWPGNIRELENVLERAVALETTAAIRLASLPDHLLVVAPIPSGPASSLAGANGNPAVPPPLFPDEGFDLERHVQDIEREYLAEPSAAPTVSRCAPPSSWV